jgi:hypothetical protein
VRAFSILLFHFPAKSDRLLVGRPAGGKSRAPTYTVLRNLRVLFSRDPRDMGWLKNLAACEKAAQQAGSPVTPTATGPQSAPLPVSPTARCDSTAGEALADDATH